MLQDSTWRAESLVVCDDAVLEGVALPSDLAIEFVDNDRLMELTKTSEHQGVAARMPAYPYCELDDLLGDLPERLLILDRIQYPMNFGTMLRSAEVFGVRHVVVAESGQSDVTASVARMSAGAVFGMRIAEVDDLPAAIERVKAGGVSVVATTPEKGVACDEVDLRGRVAIVIGRESDGVSPEILAVCDQRVLIPQEGTTQSLNAAASAAIILYEASRQRRG